MASKRDVAYCTLLTSDHYLPGAVVLAHSLNDNGTKAKVVALFTPETLQESTVRELQSVYDEVIPVQLSTNSTPANLLLMDRLDLISSFTKIELWRQTQFSKIVYLDADVLALRAPDELLSIEEDFAAAPDIGWPDIFNSGVMVLRPNLQDYYALRELADRGISFDGGDQGLLNTHFKNWHRLSFTYNCTPSGNYQYMPAYRHFESTISLVHFIGSQKPWTQSRHAFVGGTPYYQLLGRWWAEYDRHYRSNPPSLPLQPEPFSFQTESHPSPYVAPQSNIPTYETAYEDDFPTWRSSTQHPFQGVSNESVTLHSSTQRQAAEDLHILRRSPVSEGFGAEVPFSAPQLAHPQPVHPPSIPQNLQSSHYAQFEPMAEVRSVVPLYVHGEEQSSVYVSVPTQKKDDYSELKASFTAQRVSQSYPSRHTEAIMPFTEPVKAPSLQPHPQVQTQPQPPPSQPEDRPFSPPRSEWDASREPPPLYSRPEGISLEKQTYTMSQDTSLFQPPSSYPEAPKNMWYEVPAARNPKSEKLPQIFPWEAHASKPTRVFTEDLSEQPTTSYTVTSQAEEDNVQAEQILALNETTAESFPSFLPSESWESYSRSNVWDEVPEINRYIEAIQQRSKSSSKSSSSSKKPSSIKITDFPTELDRPSLPVTPAPMRRSFWDGQEGQHDQDQQGSMSYCKFPVADGVPNQCDWNPLDRLEELRQRQVELLSTPPPPPPPVADIHHQELSGLSDKTEKPDKH